MPEDITCFACEQEPTQQCPRCGRPYCDEHGEDVCDACLEPASGLPSFTLYRGSLLALLIGTALAVWLILQPPGDSVDSAAAPQVVTPTEPAVAQPTANLPGSSPQLSPTAGAGAQTPNPAATATSETPPEETPPAGADTATYTIQAGDTLFGVCSTLSSLDPTECVDQLLVLNGISIDTSLTPGEEVIVPLQ